MGVLEQVANIKDVAKKAGVSVNTVSRYLNNRGYISDETRQKIKDAIEELNYIPNQVARNLFKNKTDLVGLVIPDIKHPFFSTMTSHIEGELDRLGYKMILCNTTNSPQKEKEYITMLQENKVDGIIIGSHSLDIDYTSIRAPIVALDRYLSPTIPVVTSDHKKGGILSAEYLIESGCKNVLQIIGYSQVKTPSNIRYQSFKETIESYGLEYHDHELDWNQFDFTSYVDIVKKLLDQYPDVDGVFSVDLVIVAYLKEALKRGIKVPEDLTLVGYDGSFVSYMTHPSFPSVVQPYDQIAKKTVEILDKLIKKEELSQLTFEIDVYMNHVPHVNSSRSLKG